MKHANDTQVSSWANFIWDRELAREVDDRSTDEFNLSPLALMETAGRFVAKIVMESGAGTNRELNHQTNNSGVIVLCGIGNNGGDGLVAARTLHEWGVRVVVFVVAEKNQQPSPLFMFQRKTADAVGVPISDWTAGSLLALNFDRAIIIDAVTGLGFRPPCAGTMLDALTEAANLKDATVVAVDIPSGLATDDGSIEHAPLPAHKTVTFGAARPLHRLMPSASCCGEITIADIGFPQAAVTKALSSRPAIWRDVDPQKILECDPWRELPKSAHKYDRGHVLVIGGSSGKIGAPIMSALAALRTGAGWCTLAIPACVKRPDILIPPELTTEDFFDGHKINGPRLQKFLNERRVSTVVIGPGWTSQCLTVDVLLIIKTWLSQSTALVIDAGGLHGIGELLSAAGAIQNGRIILTPHPGEWQKLQHESVPPPLTPDGVKRAKQLARCLGAHIIYKNAAPVILSPDSDAPLICHSGSNILARAGTGDILAGTIAAHLSARCDAELAAARSYTLVARAAWMAGQELGNHSVLPTDIIFRLGTAFSSNTSTRL